MASIQVAQAPVAVVSLVLDGRRISGATLYNNSGAGVTIYVAETPAQLNELDATGNPADGVPIPNGQSLALLPGWTGPVYAVSIGGQGQLRILYGEYGDGVLATILNSILGILTKALHALGQ